MPRRPFKRSTFRVAPRPAKVFVGQRKDPFVVALGKTFDLINLNPLAASGGVDDLADKNVSSIVWKSHPPA